MGENDVISNNEWLIMDILWRDGETKSAAISAELKESKGWADPTIRTFLKRLIAKGVAAARQDTQDKRVYWYYPAVSKQDYIAGQTKGHLRRYYNGNLPQLVAGLLRAEDISEQELTEIENILKSAADKKED